MTVTDVVAEIGEERAVIVERHDDSGRVLGLVQLDQEYFGTRPNVPLLHQVVTAQLAAKRAGTHSTKTRAEVSGGGAKPYRQKGTGRARQGTIRAPQFAGGGVVFGPKPRDYRQSTPRKMVRLALRSALSDRASDGRVVLIDRFSYEIPKTKDAISTLSALGLDGRVLVVLRSDDVVASRSFANLPEIDVVEGGQLTAYDVLVCDWLVFTDDTVPGIVADAPDGTPGPSRERPVRVVALAKSELDDDVPAGLDSEGEDEHDSEGERLEVSEPVDPDARTDGNEASGELGEGDAEAADDPDAAVTGAARDDTEESEESAE